MRNSLKIVIAFKAWEVNDPGPIALEFIKYWNQVPGREPLQLFHKNTPISPITLEAIKKNVKRFDFFALKLKSSLKRGADIVQFYIVQPYPAMQEKYPEGVYGVTSLIEVSVLLEKIDKQKGYSIESFIDLIKLMIVNANVRSVSMSLDTEAMVEDAFHVTKNNVGTSQGVWWADIFSYLSKHEMDKQFALLGGEGTYLSICKNHGVNINYCPELYGYFIKMPFGFHDTPEMRTKLLEFNRDLCDHKQNTKDHS